MIPGPLMLDIASTELTKDEAELLKHPAVGGLIFFARNFSSREQIVKLVADIRACRPDILLAVDQEGGRVQRFKNGFTEIPPMQDLGRYFAQSPDKALSLAFDCGWLLASEILACDIDFSFAPVLDVDDERCWVIANRAFSRSPDVVIKLAGRFIAGMKEAGMASTGKHFPGHGSVSADSHKELPVDERGLAEVMAEDGITFSSLMAESLDAVMPAHILFPKVDGQPVGFSEHWLKQILRGDLAFDGVIFSDDLSMEGASGAGSYSERAKLALGAGCDMVLACNRPEGAREVLAWLERNPQAPNKRLQRMKGDGKLSWSDLEALERYQRTRQELQGLQVVLEENEVEAHGV